MGQRKTTFFFFITINYWFR